MLGNPPFSGARKAASTQRAQIRAVAGLAGGTGSLDYVAGWLLKAGSYVKSTGTPIAFVTTNSITQGEQVAELWPKLFGERGLELAFGHRTFAWPGKAAVHCVIVGMVKRADEPREKRLFSYSWDGRGEATESRHESLTAYLLDGSSIDHHLVVVKALSPLSPRPRMQFGNMPNDGGNLILTEAQRSAIIGQSETLGPFIRPLIGAEDYINGGLRYCLWLSNAPASAIRASPIVRERIASNREYRERSTRPATRKLGSSPGLFGEIRHTGEPFVLVPRHSSERREYVPISFFDGTAIAHDSAVFVPNGGVFDFGVLTSAMHMAWLRQIGGRLKSDYRYSVSLVYNTFPWPAVTSAQRKAVETRAQAVLDARALPKNSTSTLAALYDPNTMPAELRKAHRELDLVVDRLYRRAPFGSDRERVEHLFPLYEALVQPTAAAPRENRRVMRRAARQKAVAQADQDRS